MQSLGLQTVLGMSNAVERVQQTTLLHGAVTAEQFKDILDKQNDLKKIEVQNVEQPAAEVMIREDMGRKERRREEEQKHEAAGKPTEEATTEGKKAAVVGEEPSQGRLLDIKV